MSKEIESKQEIEDIWEKIKYDDPEISQSRIKTIVKSDPKIKSVGRYVPCILAKAAEMFIYDLTIQSIMNSKSNDISAENIEFVIRNCETYDFLSYLLPKKEGKEDEKEDENLLQRPLKDPDIKQ